MSLKPRSDATVVLLTPQANVAYQIIFNNVGLWLGYALRKKQWEVKFSPKLESLAERHAGHTSLLGLSQDPGEDTFQIPPCSAHNKAFFFPCSQQLGAEGTALAIPFGREESEALKIPLITFCCI